MKPNSSNNNQSGSSLLITVLAVTLLASLVAVSVDYTSSIARNAQRDRAFNDAVEIGDGYISVAFADWRQTCKSTSAQNPPTQIFSPVPSPTPGDFPSFPGYTVANYNVQAVDPLVTLSSNDPPVSALPTASPPPKTTGPGTGTFSYFYLASVDITLPAVSKVRGKDLTAKVRRIFEKRYVSPWNWAMMYNGNLELHPDSSLTLNGWVHSNGNMYVGNGSASATPAPTLTLTDRLTYQGNYTVGFDPNDGAHSGQVNVAEPIYPAVLPPGHEQYYSMFGWDVTKFDTTDNNPNNDGYHEIIEKPVAGASPDPFASQRFYNQAYNTDSSGNSGIVVNVDASNVITVGYGGTTYSSAPSGNGSPERTAWDAVMASVHTNFPIQDNREQTTVRLVNFDVAQFMTKTVKNFNEIIYINDTSASSSNHRGVRILNGATLPSGGLTIASPNPVYIQGDFNSGKTSSVQPPSNTGDPTDPDAGGYTRQPASILADAITLLSNAWSDANSAADLSSRIASNTTVNAALVAGNVPSNGTNYSGGGENFVRFLEDWTSKTFTYYGSMIDVYASTQGTGVWGNGNVYLPPQQYWYFDDTLSVDNSGNPVTVPGYVSTVAYLQQQRWYLAK